MNRFQQTWFCIKPTVKGGGSSVRVWGGMTLEGVGPIHTINGLMDQYVYMNIPNDILLPFANDQMPRDWLLLANNNPKSTASKVKEFLNHHSVNVLPWPLQ